MAVSAEDLQWRYSVPNATVGDELDQPDSEASLGGYVAINSVDPTSLWDAITADENSAGDTEYRCVFVHNANGIDTLSDAVVWLASQTEGGADIAIAADPTAASPSSSGTQQALIADDDSDSGGALAGLTFSSPTTRGTGISLGDIGPSQVKAVWLQRSILNATATSDDSASLRLEGTTV